MVPARTKLSPFVFIDDISYKKENLLEKDPELLKCFDDFLTTRHFSYFGETLFIANEINMCQTLNKKEKHDYFFYGIPARKRWTKWNKKSTDENVKLVQRYHDYSYKKAAQVVSFFKEEDFEYMRNYFYEGGKTK